MGLSKQLVLSQLWQCYCCYAVGTHPSDKEGTCEHASQDFHSMDTSRLNQPRAFIHAANGRWLSAISGPLQDAGAIADCRLWSEIRGGRLEIPGARFTQADALPGE